VGVGVCVCVCAREGGERAGRGRGERDVETQVVVVSFVVLGRSCGDVAAPIRQFFLSFLFFPFFFSFSFLM
jgi:hypothetical protein